MLMPPIFLVMIEPFIDPIRGMFFIACSLCSGSSYITFFMKSVFTLSSRMIFSGSSIYWLNVNAFHLSKVQILQSSVRCRLCFMKHMLKVHPCMQPWNNLLSCNWSACSMCHHPGWLSFKSTWRPFPLHVLCYFFAFPILFIIVMGLKKFQCHSCMLMQARNMIWSLGVSQWKIRHHTFFIQHWDGLLQSISG